MEDMVDAQLACSPSFTMPKFELKDFITHLKSQVFPNSERSNKKIFLLNVCGD